MANIFREPTIEEKKDMVILNPVKKEKTIFDVFRDKCESEYQKSIKNKKPFCLRCARIDFKDLVERTLTEAERNTYETDINKFKIKMPDFSQYAKEDRFESLGERETLNPANGAKNEPAKMLKSQEYRCKVRGCGLSLFIV